MDWMNLLSLIFFATSAHGISSLYKGKTDKDSESMAHGIVELFLGTIGFSLSSPIFTNVILSLGAAIGFSFIVIAYIAGVFVSLKQSEEVWHVDAQLISGSDTETEFPALEKSKKSRALVPISFGNVAKALDYVRKRK